MSTTTAVLATLLATTSLFIPRAHAYDPWERNCDTLCLTSFRWCSTEYGPDEGLTGCSYPEDAYPYFDRQKGSNPALILMDKEYNLTWKMANPDYPVLIRWSFPDSDTAGSNVSVKWETNTTRSSFLFRPGQILESFPTERASNMSTAEAKGLAATDRLNSIDISQPGLEDVGDISEQFSIQRNFVRHFLETAESQALSEERRKWKLGVGIGVGLGVPILMALTAFITRALTKKKVAKVGDEAK